jgi:3-oxoadipate enol-lactonase
MRVSVSATSLLLTFAVSSAPCAAQSRTLDVGDARINYVVKGTGPAVVLIHGWALDHREWSDQIAALATRYRVVAFDRRGSGKSTGFVDVSADPGDLRALLDTLGIRSAVLVGHSAGAEVAYRFTAALPERVVALVLYGGAAPQGFPIPAPGPNPLAGITGIARQYGIDSLMRMVRALPRFQPGANRSAAAMARIDSMAADYSGRDLLEDHPPSGRFPPAQFDVVRQWRIPTLLISGEREPPRWHLVADSLARWMPSARKVVIPGGGHAVHFDEPERFNRALLDFLSEVVKRRSTPWPSTPSSRPTYG